MGLEESCPLLQNHTARGPLRVCDENNELARICPVFCHPLKTFEKVCFGYEVFVILRRSRMFDEDIARRFGPSLDHSRIEWRDVHI